MTEKELPAETVVLHDIIAMLEYYRALGIERIPFAFKIKNSPSPLSSPSRGEDGSKSVSLSGGAYGTNSSPPLRGGAIGEGDICSHISNGTGIRPVAPVNSSRVGEAQSTYTATRHTSLEKAKLLSDLRDEIGDCRRCKLSVKRKNIVFGEGNPDARLMFVGEGPGEEEDLQGRPFVGKAGILLDRLIEKMELRRDEVYIANIVKCRPPENREPEKDEVASCRGFVERQIDIISPGVIMALGKVALQTLMNDYTLKITVARGKFLDFRGFAVMPTFHPAYLLRNPSDKWKTWADAQKALEKLHLRS